jgi:2-polyprenyl-3-methyl-5-hydroxy-6-metoxy-1,4-benzoquinol methylase
MEKDNINTKEYWNINYKENGFYQDHSSNDWNFNHEFIELALPKIPCKILEVACGLGHNAKFAASLGHFIVATDFSQVVIDESKKRFSDPRIRYECLTLEESTEYFRDLDVIMGFEIIEHYRDPVIPLFKIYCSLKEGGMFIFSVPQERGKYGEWCQHYSLFNYSTLGELLFRAGFKKFIIFKTMFSDQSIMGVAVK